MAQKCSHCLVRIDENLIVTNIGGSKNQVLGEPVIIESCSAKQNGPHTFVDDLHNKMSAPKRRKVEEIRKVFPTNGHVNKHSHFVVDRSEKVREITKSLINGQNLVIAAPRQSGKTSLLLEVKAALPDEYLAILISLNDCPTESQEEFWKFVSQEVRVTLSDYSNPTNPISFADSSFLKYACNKVKREKNKDVILLLDELSVVRGTMKRKFEQVLQKLNETEVIKSILGAGVYGNIFIPTQPKEHRSPWNLNVCKYEQFVFFTEEDISELLKSWIKAREISNVINDYSDDEKSNDVVFLPDLVKIVFFYSGGQPGIVSHCGNFLDYRQSKGHCLGTTSDEKVTIRQTIDTIKENFANYFIEYCAIYQPFSNVSENIEEFTEEQRKSLFYVYSLFDQHSKKISVSFTDIKPHDNNLTLFSNLGLFEVKKIPLKGYDISITSPLIRSIIYKALNHESPLPKINYFNCLEKSNFDFSKFMANLAEEADWQNFKKTMSTVTHSGSSNSFYGKEKIYCCERTFNNFVSFTLYLTLQYDTLKHFVMEHRPVPTKKKKVDLAVNWDEKWTLYEYLANATTSSTHDTSFCGHVVKLNEHYIQSSTETAWLINFDHRLMEANLDFNSDKKYRRTYFSDEVLKTWNNKAVEDLKNDEKFKIFDANMKKLKYWYTIEEFCEKNESKSKKWKYKTKNKLHFMHFITNLHFDKFLIIADGKIQTRTRSYRG